MIAANRGKRGSAPAPLRMPATAKLGARLTLENEIRLAMVAELGTFSQACAPRTLPARILDALMQPRNAHLMIELLAERKKAGPEA